MGPEEPPFILAVFRWRANLSLPRSPRIGQGARRVGRRAGRCQNRENWRPVEAHQAECQSRPPAQPAPQGAQLRQRWAPSRPPNTGKLGVIDCRPAPAIQPKAARPDPRNNEEPGSQAGAFPPKSGQAFRAVAIASASLQVGALFSQDRPSLPGQTCRARCPPKSMQVSKVRSSRNWSPCCCALGRCECRATGQASTQSDTPSQTLVTMVWAWRRAWAWIPPRFL